MPVTIKTDVGDIIVCAAFVGERGWTFQKAVLIKEQVIVTFPI